MFDRCFIARTSTGLWYQAESVFRDWAIKYGSVYVISGSIFDADNDGFRDKDEQTKR